MLNRREFVFGSALALAALAGSARAEDGALGINDRLEQIVKTAEGKEHAATTEKNFVENPDGAVVHWRWAHFRPNVDLKFLPLIKSTNRELYDVMNAVRAVPELGFDHIIHEGFIQGEHHRQMDENLRMFRLFVAHHMGLDTRHPAVARGMLGSLQMVRSTPWIEHVDGMDRHMDISALTRLGAAYILAWQKDMKILPLEDKELDDGADEAEQQRDPKQHDKWIQLLRNEHVLALARGMKEEIKHVFLGFGHRLKFATQDSNQRHGRRFSHLEITVPAIREYEEQMRINTE